ncbi:sensor histidine kinase [Streptomyces sp. NRRL F-5135]|uniref:sensor histidine kinase n=1 Tax=Streptomyces sp. NRRL F-5135 TaxID=1463858 RepID=UPI000A8720E3|nr:histidine kinase [Streptomyces sp. NRRL F-5135]
MTLAVTALVVTWTLLLARSGHEPPARAAGGWALVAVGCGALHFRRVRPLPVAVITLLASGLYYPLSVSDGPLILTFALALYTLAAEGHFTASAALAAVTLLAVGFGELRQGSGRRQIDDTSLVMLAGWLISLVAVGRAQRTRLAYLHEVEQRALAAEREQEARARQSATEERLRIARDLHDVLGHSISLINVQSGAALHRLGKRPEPPVALGIAEEALRTVKSTSKEALRELRGALGVLRQADEAAPTAPAPGLDRLGALIEGARSTGLEVRLRTEGSRRSLPPPVDLAAYRIVQESLTNVTRHAGARTALVTVVYGDTDLRVRIDDDGRATDEGRRQGEGPDTGPTGSGTGSGIRGMAERAQALGGKLTAHHVRDGFRVDARLPLNRF